ncbi:MAG: pyridoxine/pyridoxal/pyridoxamine kinase [Negativicutes bacterium]|nr:pyridoxine/pyridoxal/pyridoxamine kinase [Negativicutes bacterium]
MTIFKAVTVAGSDTSGGAGLQADLKTFQELGVYGMTAITVIVAQNPRDNWSHVVYPLPIEVLDAQLETILAGIGVDALKTGMLATAEVIALVAEKIAQYQVKNVVIDPVLVCKGTDEVLHPESAVAIREKLAPLATIITPNIFEAKQLSGMSTINTLDDVKEAARAIYALGPKNVLIKGGAKLQTPTAVDVLYDGRDFTILESAKIDTKYTHGAGCTYGAAVTAGLAKGLSVNEAVQQAKNFITAAIRQSFPLNAYVGPTWHAAHRSDG